jgi:hypothetical protein
MSAKILFFAPRFELSSRSGSLITRPPEFAADHDNSTALSPDTKVVSISKKHRRVERKRRLSDAAMKGGWLHPLMVDDRWDAAILAAL